MYHRVSTFIIASTCAFAVLLYFSSCAKKEAAKTQTEHHEGDGHDHSGHDHDLPRIAGVDWCPAHRAPESQCTRCHPELAETFKAKNDWCKNHGVPDTHCLTCNPAIRFPQEEQYRTKAAAGKVS